MKISKKNYIIIISFLVLVSLLASISANTLNVIPSDLGVKNGADADISGQIVHLETTGAVGGGDEARIVIQASDVGISTLNDLTSISWDANVLEGYAPHVDVFLDNGKTLVFEYAKVDPTECDDSADYPTGEINTFDDKGIVENSAYAWLSSGPPGPCGDVTFDGNHNSLSEWKGTDGSGEIIKIEIEIDNWISQSEAEIDNIQINGELIVFDSIQDAIDDASAGDIIEVREGTYEETLQINTDDLTIKAAEGEYPIIQAPDEIFTSVRRLIDLRGDGIIFEDFEVVGNGNNDLEDYDGSYLAIRIEGEGITVEGNVVRDALTGIQTTSADSTIVNNILDNTISNVAVGISLQNDGNIVTGNDISAINEGFGLASFDTTFSNNLIEVEEGGYEVKVSGDVHGIQYLGSIQDGINAANDGDTVYVAAGTFEEDLVIDKEINLIGPNANINPNTETREDEATITGQITISSDNVIIKGFTITNGQISGMGIYSADYSNLEITNNIITDIGNGEDDVVGRGIVIVSSSSAIDNIEILNNQIKNIISGLRTGSSSKSSAGIAVGWSTGIEDITNLLIQNNTIYNIQADISPWEVDTKGQGAYGILINHGSAGGQTVAPQILDNTIYNLEGLWAHAIGLEGDTPDAIVEGNEINDLIDHKDPSDAVDLFFEANPSADTITISNNIFLATIGWGLAMHPDLISAYPGLVITATNNWWGTNDGEEIADMVSENVDYDPWIGKSEADVETEAGVPEEVDTTGTDTSITLTTIDSSSGTISVQQQSNDPQGGFSASALGKFISIESEIPEEEITQVEIGISYTDAEILASGIDETTLKVYWWDSDTSSWIFEGTTEGCHDAVGCYGVDTINNYVWIVTDHFSDFGAGGEDDTEGPVIILDHLSEPYPNPDDEEFTIYVYANITDPSGVADYPELAWKIDGVEYSTSMNPLDDLYYGGITAPKIDGLEILYKITAEDLLNNSNQNPPDYEHLFYYDGTAPTTTLTIGDPKYEDENIYVTSATGFTLSCDDGENGNGCDKTYYKINDGEFTEYSSPFTISGDDGEYTVYYYSIDNSSNEEETNSQIIILDNEEPATTDDSTSDWTDENVIVILTPSDEDGSGVANTYYCVDTDGTCTPDIEYVDSISVTCEEDIVCKKYVNYQSTDNLGNEESIKTSNQINIDKEKPSTSDDGTDNEWHNENVLITLLPLDGDGSGISTTYYCVDQDNSCNPLDGEIGTDVTVSEEGENYVRYLSIDNVGNQEEIQEAENTVRIDKTDPVLEYYSRTNPTDTDMKADDTDAPETVGYGYYDHIGDGFKWTSDDEFLQDISIRFYDGYPDDGGVLIEGANVAGCDLDPLWDEPTDGGEYGGTFYEKYKEFGLWGSDFIGDYDGTDTCDPLFDNIHNAGIVYYEITAYDLAGNEGRLVGILNFNQGWERDTEVPTTTDDYMYDDEWVNTAQTITLTEDCGSSGCAWTKYCTTESCNPAEGTDYSEAITISTEGTNYFRYTSKDNAYNTQDTIELIIKIDLTIPTIDDGYADDGEWVGESQTIILTPNDGAGSGINQVLYCEEDECDPETEGTILESPYELLYTTSQDTIVRYVAIDNAGNPSDVGEFNVKIDLENPTIIDDAPEGWQNTGFTVTLTPDDENGIEVVKTCEGTECDPETEGTILESPYELTYSSDQDIVVRYQAWDVIGNPSDVGEFEVKIDTIRPDVDDSGPSGTLNDNEVEIFVTTDEETICKYDTTSKSFDNMEFTLGTGDLETDHSTILDLSDGTYNYHIRCQDKANNNLLATEISLLFTVDTAENFGYTADLTPTWDTFNLPQFVLIDLGYDTAELRSPENILESLNGNYEEIWYYDGTNWLSYDPEAPDYLNDLEEFNDVVGNPYWIKMISSDRLELEDLSV